MSNYYTLNVYKKQDKHVFVVTIYHTMYTGVLFFKTLDDAIDYITEIKNELAIFGELYHNPDAELSDGYINVIKIVLSCDNIHIGKNGKTYYKGV